MVQLVLVIILENKRKLVKYCDSIRLNIVMIFTLKELIKRIMHNSLPFGISFVPIQIN